MKTRKIEDSDWSEFIKFNEKVYPNRKKVGEVLSYRLLVNPFRTNDQKTLISLNGENAIIGQLLLMPSQFRFTGEVHDAFWGMDYIVENEYRGTVAGTNLCKKAAKESY